MMSIKFIDINGTLIEVDSTETGAMVVSDDNTKNIKDKDLKKMTTLLKGVTKDLKDSFDVINQDVKLKEAEVELSFGVEASGNFFIAKGKASSQFKVKLTFIP